MRKLYDLKNWYSLGDAAKRLTTTLGEDISINDILQMTVEGHLPLSWYMRHVAAQQVAPYTHICSWDGFSLPQSYYTSPEAKIGFLSVLPHAENGEKYNANTLTVRPSLKIISDSDEVQYLDGHYRLDLEMCGAIKDWVLSLITGTGGDLISIDGYFVQDNDGGLWRVMERFTNEEMEVREKARKETAPPQIYGYQKPINHSSYFYPSDGCTDPADLGITKGDLEAFETSLLSKTLPKIDSERPLKTRERDTLLKLVIGMAVAGYRYNPKAAKNNAISEITSDLDKLGIAVSDDTVRKWLNEAAELLPVEALEA